LKIKGFVFSEKIFIEQEDPNGLQDSIYHAQDFRGSHRQMVKFDK
jgi:hypothetical protein